MIKVNDEKKLKNFEQSESKLGGKMTKSTIVTPRLTTEGMVKIDG